MSTSLLFVNKHGEEEREKNIEIIKKKHLKEVKKDKTINVGCILNSPLIERKVTGY